MHDRDRSEGQGIDHAGRIGEVADGSNPSAEPTLTTETARVELTLEETFGSVTPTQRPEDFEELSRLAKEEKVARTLRELQTQSQE